MKNSHSNQTCPSSGRRSRRDDLVFRVFLSSTFQDLQEERNALQEFVWPALEAYCRERQAFFQAIDLRWGISSEASLDQQTMSICVDELLRCQELSPRPNFVILLGNRYGWCPLPAQIPADEFHELLENLEDSNRSENRALLLWDNPPSPPPTGMGWYALDENALHSAHEQKAVPGEYVLRGRRPGTPEAEPDTWDAIQERLRGILLDAAQRAGWAEDDPRRRKFVLSATHQEIEHGAFRAANPDRHVFVYLRDILDPPQSAVAGGLVDGDQSRVNELRSALCDLIPQNKRTYQVQCVGAASPLAYCETAESPPSDTDEAMPWYAECSPYLSRLCSDVHRDLKAIIKSEIDDYDAQPHPTRESDIHARHGRDIDDLLIGREAEVARLSNYLNSYSSHPMLVFGPYGIGKTALLAGAWLSHSRHAKSVFRSIGVTPRSTNLHQLLFDIARELVPDSEALAEDEPVVSFMTALAQSGRRGKVVIWIDGLEQFTSQHEAHLFAWFPSSLFANVKLIASANPDGDRVNAGLTALRNRVPPEQVLDLEPLSHDAGPHLMNAWLGKEGRTLQPAQAQAVLETFDNCRRPITLRLGCHLASRWRSWDAPLLAGRSLASFQSVPDLLEGVLNWAAQNHGEPLVSHAFGGIAVSREGLAENELLAILSRDGPFLSEVMTRYPDSPPVHRLPPIVWYRLYRDVEFLLGMRQVDTAKTLSFVHEVIADVVRTHVLAPGVGERTCRVALADYFETESAGTRQADELPHQLAVLQDWERLKGILLRVPLSELVWSRHGVELVAYWVKIKENCDIADIAGAYGDSWKHALANGIIPASVAIVVGNLGDSASAETIADGILDYLREQRAPGVDIAAATCGKANFLAARNQQKEARFLFEEALAIYESVSKRRSVAACLAGIAGTFAGENPEESMRLLTEAEAVWREVCSPYGIVECLGNRANIQIAMGNTARAIELQREAVDICLELRLDFEVAEHRSSLGMMLSRAGETRKALQHLEDAKTAYRGLGLVGPLGACLGQMANIYARQSDPRRAFDLNEEALALMQGSGQHVWLATCLLNQAKTCLVLRKYQHGKKMAEEALAEIRLCSAPPPIRQDCLKLLFELRGRADRGH